MNYTHTTLIFLGIWLGFFVAWAVWLGTTV